MKTSRATCLIGKKFGRLLVVSRGPNYIQLRNGKLEQTAARWECICDCENTLITSGNRLRSGKTKSCGCIVSTQNKLSTSPSYRSWKAMNQRCYDLKNISYKNYGAKGITVCDRWKDSFHNFLQDMGQRGEGWSIDRINFFGNYSPDNCKWSTAKEQASNKSSNNIISAHGQDNTLAEWAEITGIPWSTIRKRIYVLGWQIEDALIKKKKKK